MRKLCFSLGIMIFSLCNVFSQNVAITDDDSYSAHSSAMLDVKSTTKGLLIPRLTTIQRTAISTPASGLLVYDTTLGGFYFYNGTSWVNITAGISSNLISYDGVNKIYLTNTNHRLGVGTNSPSAKMVVKGDATMGLDQPLFSVVNKNNDTIFAVYDGGVRIYVDDNPAKASGSKGGFAVGGFSPNKGAVTNEYLRVTPDSVRIYVEDLPLNKASGSKGGFAVGGFSPNKAVPYNLLTVNGDSANLFIGDSTAGFGITNVQNGANQQFLNLTTENYFIGHQSGIYNTTGKYNSFFGYMSGMKNQSGLNNIFIGYQSGMNNLKGTRNTFVGYMSGYTNNIGGCSGSCSSNNTFIGSESGYSNNTGGSNTFIGNKSGYSVIDASSGVYIGDRAGQNNTNANANTYIGYISGMSNLGGFNTYTGYSSGSYGTNGTYNCNYGYLSGTQGAGSNNSFYGVYSGYNNDIGGYNVAFGANAGRGVYGNSYNNNTFIGASSGYSVTTGSNNVCVGYQSGYNITTGTANVFIGRNAGYNETGSSKLYIDNSNTSSPLIGGDFSVNRVGINRMPTNYTLEVGGTIWANGSSITAGATTWSDVRYKTNITQLKNSLENIIKLRGVTYDWKYDKFSEKNFPNGNQIGVIAQEVEKIYPELVITDNEGYKSVAYEKLTPILIEAIKELNLKVEKLEKENNDLKASNNEILNLKSEIEKIKTTLELSTNK